MKTNQALNEELKSKFYGMIEEYFSGKEDCLRVPLTDDSTSSGFKLAIPTVDSENNEKTIIISLVIPKGSRDGQEYDVYSENERYLENVKENEAKKKALEEKKAREEAERERKRAAKAVKKKEA